MIWAWQWKRLLVEARRARAQFGTWRMTVETDLVEAWIHRPMTLFEYLKFYYRRKLLRVRPPGFPMELQAGEALGAPLKVPISLGWDPFFSDVEGRIVDPAEEFLGEPDEEYLGEPDEDGVELAWQSNQGPGFEIVPKVLEPLDGVPELSAWMDNQVAEARALTFKQLLRGYAAAVAKETAPTGVVGSPTPMHVQWVPGLWSGDVGKAATSKSTSRMTVPPLPPRSSESQVKRGLPRRPGPVGEPRKTRKPRASRKTRKSRKA